MITIDRLLLFIYYFMLHLDTKGLKQIIPDKIGDGRYWLLIFFSTVYIWRPKKLVFYIRSNQFFLPWNLLILESGDFHLSFKSLPPPTNSYIYKWYTAVHVSTTLLCFFPMGSNLKRNRALGFNCCSWKEGNQYLGESSIQ